MGALGTPVRGNASYAYDSVDNAMIELERVGVVVVVHVSGIVVGVALDRESMALFVGTVGHVSLGCTMVVVSIKANPCACRLADVV